MGLNQEGLPLIVGLLLMNDKSNVIPSGLDRK